MFHRFAKHPVSITAAHEWWNARALLNQIQLPLYFSQQRTRQCESISSAATIQCSSRPAPGTRSTPTRATVRCSSTRLRRGPSRNRLKRVALSRPTPFILWTQRAGDTDGGDGEVVAGLWQAGGRADRRPTAFMAFCASTPSPDRPYGPERASSLAPAVLWPLLLRSVGRR